jgi:aminopeptidase YwaD
VTVGLLASLLLAGCTSPDGATDRATDGSIDGAPAERTVAATPEGSPSPGKPPAPLPPGDGGPRLSPEPASARHVRVGTAWEAVEHLAGRIGPRHGTSPAYRRAAGWVEGRFQALGYDVSRQPFDVPGGVSWGVPVEDGRSVNLVATQGAVDTTRPHVIVGAHLDTVPQAPGAEDNASGVGALLAVAEAVAGRHTRLPVVLVAFGAEEPRGPGDDDHHYGSRFYVSQLGAAERSALVGMVSLDRVGVGNVMPVCSATDNPDPLRAELLAAARRVDAPTLPCTGNRASDHWSFVRNGLPGVRLGSTSFAGYHSPQDVPSVVNRDQLARAARITVAWLSP